MPSSDRKAYETRIRQALHAATSGTESSINAAAASHGVSHATLYARLHGRQSGFKNGRRICPSKQALTPAQEDSMIKWMNQLYRWGFPARLDMLRSMAEKLADRVLGVNWVTKFLRRHKDTIQTRYSRQLDNNRARAADPKQLIEFYQLWQTILHDKRITIDNIYNMDETGVLIGYAAGSKIIVPTGKHQRFVTQDGNRESITVIECIGTTTNKVIPPMLIFTGKGHLAGWHRDTQAPGNWHMAISPNGWTDSDLGRQWLERVFEPNTRPTTSRSKHRLLLLDGHSSHITIDFIQYCIDHEITALCLPAHSSHLVQPLDVGIFSTYQRNYGRQVDDAIRNGITGINKTVFISLLVNSRAATFASPEICASAWKGAGLIPYDPDLVLTQCPNYAPLRPQTPPLDLPIQQPITTPKTSIEACKLTTVLRQRSFLLSSPTRARIEKIAKVAEASFADAVIARETQTQLRNANKQRKQKQPGDQAIISTARVLTIQEAVDALKAKGEEKAQEEQAKQGRLAQRQAAKVVKAAKPKRARGRPPVIRAHEQQLLAEHALDFKLVDLVDLDD